MNVNMNAAAALVANLNYVEVQFTGTQKLYTYFLQQGMHPTAGDIVIVPVHEASSMAIHSGPSDVLNAAKVKKVGKVSELDLTHLRATKTVIALVNLQDYHEHREALKDLAQELTIKKNAITQDQILASFGVTDRKELASLSHFATEVTTDEG